MGRQAQSAQSGKACQRLTSKPHHTAGRRLPAPVCRLLLELRRHDRVRLEKLGRAAVQADRLALVEVAFAVVGREALLRAHLNHAGKRVLA